MKTEYTIDYFIEKFNKIPAELWTTYKFESDGKCCALGLCGARFDSDIQQIAYTPEALALFQIFVDAKLPLVMKVNDCIFDREFTQRHPKFRILHALKMAKKKEENVQA